MIRQSRRAQAVGPREVFPGPVELPVPGRRPDPAVLLTVAAFAIGVVVASVAGLAFRIGHGDTVPAGVHQETVTQLAAEQAARDAADRQIAAQADTLADADALARRLVAALSSPASVSAADLAELRRAVTVQSRTIERERVRVVRVPVTAPAPTPIPVPAPVGHRPQPARQPGPTPTAAPSPSGCTIALLGTCLAR